MSNEPEFSEELGKTLKWAFAECQGATAYSMDRERTYDGQDHTTNGTRGKTVVEGLTMRDVADCIVKAMLACGGDYRENPIWDDVYKLNFEDIDPIAVVQNAMVNIEKMMDIYPNVEPLEFKESQDE
jgi:hypothetical protein